VAKAEEMTVLNYIMLFILSMLVTIIVAGHWCCWVVGCLRPIKKAGPMQGWMDSGWKKQFLKKEKKERKENDH